MLLRSVLDRQPDLTTDSVRKSAGLQVQWHDVVAPKTHCYTSEFAHNRFQSRFILFEQGVELFVFMLQRLVLEDQM